MNLRSSAVSVADWMMTKSGAARLLYPRYSGLGSALMFHRLDTYPKRMLYHDNSFSEDGLITLLDHCLRLRIDVVNVAEALRRLGDAGDGGRRFVLLTFDDGYRDNYTRALPIFRRLGLPFTVFVCSAMIERTLDYWWGGLIDLFKSHDEVDIEAMQMRFRLRNERDREAALHRTTKWVEGDIVSRSAALESTFKRYGVSPADLLDQHAMTEEELCVLSQESIATIGGHGFSHRPLASLSEPEAMHEIVANRTHLERITAQPVIDFAYPFGDKYACSWRDAELVRAAGYRSAFTTRVGNLFSEHSESPFMLPRGAMHPRREESYHADAQFAGVHQFLKGRAGTPINPDTLPSSRARIS